MTWPFAGLAVAFSATLAIGLIFRNFAKKIEKSLILPWIFLISVILVLAFMGDFSGQIKAIVAGALLLQGWNSFFAKKCNNDKTALIILAILAFSWFLGLRVHFVTKPWGEGVRFLNESSLPLTVLWLYLLMRSLRFSQMLPGLSSGLGILLMGIFMAYSIKRKMVAAAFLPATVLGALLAVNLLAKGWNPSPSSGHKVTNGPISIELLGFFIGALAISGMSKSLATLSLILPLLLISVPIVFLAGMMTLAYHKGGIQGSLAEHKLGRSLSWTVTPPRVILLIYFISAWMTIIFTSLASSMDLGQNAFVILLSTLLLGILYRVVLLRKGPSWGDGAGGRDLPISGDGAGSPISDEGAGSPFSAPMIKSDILESRTSILGVLVDRLTMAQACELACARIEKGIPGYIVTPNSLIIDYSLKDLAYRRALNGAFLSIPDGAGLVWAADLNGTPMPERVPGIDLLNHLLMALAEKGQRVFLLGAKPQVVEKATEIIKEKYKGINICGYHHGYFQDNTEKEGEILAMIRQAKPDLLVLALGVPRQEFWISKNMEKTGAPLAICVGGSLDVISGTLQRAPDWAGRFGIEWLYRLLRQPWRILRMMGLPRFVFFVLAHSFDPQKSLGEPEKGGLEEAKIATAQSPLNKLDKSKSLE